MAFSSSDRPALLLVDLQKGFSDIAYWGGGRNNPDAETKAGELLQLWRIKDLPVYHVKHCSTTPVSPLRATHPGNEIMDIVKPINGEPVIEKNVNSAFIGTDLEEQLDRAGITKLVIVGMTTDHCISTTTRMAGNLGYETYLVADATATFNKKGFDGKTYPAELIHETAMASLNDEFATVVTSDVVKRMIS
ncbi:MAG: cysteine hydrolase family protein [Bacteroidota bacterium]